MISLKNNVTIAQLFGEDKEKREICFFCVERERSLNCNYLQRRVDHNISIYLCDMLRVSIRYVGLVDYLPTTDSKYLHQEHKEEHPQHYPHQSVSALHIHRCIQIKYAQQQTHYPSYDSITEKKSVNSVKVGVISCLSVG